LSSKFLRKYLPVGSFCSDLTQSHPNFQLIVKKLNSYVKRDKGIVNYLNKIRKFLV